MNALRSPVLALAGAGLARALLAVPPDRLPGGSTSWTRLNYRGRPVSLQAGPVVALAGAASAAAGAPSTGLRRSVALAGLAAGVVGGYDDSRPDPATDKGFRGHLRALADGRVTSGVAKVAGIGAAGIAAAGPVARGPVDRLVAGGIVAGTANLVNLLDLRPGRALLIGAPLLRGRNGAMVAGPLGVAVALLGDDLGERTMLGDAGANAVGAILGVRLAAGVSGRRRWALLAGLAGLTAFSEVVSFSRVIRATPGLRELDALGRRPDGPPR